jgi:hypothetical protein
MTDFTPADVMAIDPVYWAVKSQIKLMGGTTFTLEGCQYMADIMRDEARWMAVMKGTQARITTAFMLRAIHSLIYRKYPKGVIYYFNDKTSVEDFSKTRFTPLIKDNPCIKKYLKSTDSVFAKKVDKAFLTLKGASATKILAGQKKDGGAVRSMPADEVIRDERDLFDEAMAKMTIDRLLDSDFKKEVDLGSPTMPDFGIHKVFTKSDQKHILIKCLSCNTWTSPAEEFPNSIKYKKSDSHSKPKPYVACIKCGKEIYKKDGELVAKYPAKYNPKYPNEGISGYHISYFDTAKFDASFLMDRYEEAVVDSSEMGGFYNTYLGFPYISIEDRLRQQDVFDCCGDALMATTSTVGTAMGADIMKTNRVVIAEKKGKEKAKIIYMARVTGFDALYDLVKQFNVKSAVVCLRPYEEAFRQFQERCSKIKVKVFGSEYRDKQRNLMKTDEESGVYAVHRTEMLDKSQTWIRSGKLEIPRRCEEVNIFAKECCNTAKVLETNEKTGDRVYRYRPVGDGIEHYRHCVGYLMLALLNLHDYEYRPVQQVQESNYDPLTWGL